MTSFSITDTNVKLQDLIRQSEQGEIIEITRQGKPVVVMVSMKEYHRLLGKLGQNHLAALREKYEFDKYGLTDEEAETFFQRDRSPSRDFKFDD